MAGSRMLLVQPDAVLCKLAARGNANAYDALYQRYRQPIFAFVFHLLGRRDGGEDAEDIAQETFTKAFAALGQKRVDGSFKHWIYTIARNRTFDHIRGGNTRALPVDAETIELKTLQSADSAAVKAEGRADLAWLVGAMAELPEQQREALVMLEMGGMSHAEIAEALNTTVPATKKLVSRGRAAVQDAAEVNGFRSHQLRKELAMAAPVLPMAAAGIGFGTTAAVGTAAVGTKVAATVLVAVAVGGGAAVVKSVHATPPARTIEASQRLPQPHDVAGSGNALPVGVQLDGKGGASGDHRSGHSGKHDSGSVQHKSGSDGSGSGDGSANSGQNDSGSNTGSKDGGSDHKYSSGKEGSPKSGSGTSGSGKSEPRDGADVGSGDGSGDGTDLSSDSGGGSNSGSGGDNGGDPVVSPPD
jgi:RNA polymerase sigma factor (sigma-70 family)